jgi:hypothetical protein
VAPVTGHESAPSVPGHPDDSESSGDRASDSARLRRAQMAAAVEPAGRATGRGRRAGAAAQGSGPPGRPHPGPLRAAFGLGRPGIIDF